MAHNPYESPENEADLPLPPSNLLATALRVLTIVGIILLVVLLLFPARRTSREAARRMQCSNHLKQIAVALQNYHDAFGAFPPAYTVDANDQPLHSWRTLILPFMEHEPLYDRIDLTKPWNDPANRLANDTHIATYHCPSASSKLAKGHTTYLGVAAPGGFFEGAKPRSLAAITDKSSNTLAVIEVSEQRAVHWMSPNDATESLILSPATEDRFSHPNVRMVAFVDGHVRALTRNTPEFIVRALITIAGNDDTVAGSDY